MADGGVQRRIFILPSQIRLPITQEIRWDSTPLLFPFPDFLLDVNAKGCVFRNNFMRIGGPVSFVNSDSVL
jgi:hypothetical protein